MLVRRDGSSNGLPMDTSRCNSRSSMAGFSVKFQDLYGFSVEGNLDDVNILNEVRERMRRQGKVWWAMEASKGSDWFAHAHVSLSMRRHLNLSAVADSFSLRKLIRKGIPPGLRSRVWFSVSGAGKKKSTVPDSYYGDLIREIDGMITPATLQIDHVS